MNTTLFYIQNIFEIGGNMKSRAKFLFGDIVVIEKDLIGVIVKTWEDINNKYNYDVYVREHNTIIQYAEEDIERYRVRHKYLNEEELEY